MPSPVLVLCVSPLLLFFLLFMSKQFQFKLVLLGVSRFFHAISLIPIAIAQVNLPLANPGILPFPTPPP